MPQALTFHTTGPQASDVLRLQHYSLSDPNNDEIVVQFLAAPINPLDLLVLAGKYPVQPRYLLADEKVAGFDGIGRVQKCGSHVKDLEPGDLVIPRDLGLGTWRTHAVLDASSLLKIHPGLDTAFAGILKTGVMPAYLLLEDMAKLKPGEWIIQNAGTGVIAQMVAQFARLKGVHTISVIRNRNDNDSAIATTKALSQNGNIVLEERHLHDSELLRDKRVVLALDAVFGSSAEDLAACLSTHATFVNYGLLGGPSVSFGLSHEHIFWKQLTFTCFRMTQQLAQRTPAEVQDLYAWFADLYHAGLLKLPTIEMVDWDVDRKNIEGDLREAVSRAQTKEIGAKKILLMFKDTIEGG